MNYLKTTTVVAAVLVMAACDFKVNNPGPVGDDALDDAGAYTAIVRGVQYNISRATSINAFYGGVAAKEFSTAGRVNPTKLPINQGQLSVDDMSGSNWTWSQTARWTAEDGVRRMRQVLAAGFANNRFAGQLLMLSALGNRVLGENFCEAVIDGGGKESINRYFQRADTAATEAIAVATAAGDVPTRQAAYVIRASARLYLGNFAGAAADASAANVPNTFVMTAPFDASTKNLFVDTNDFAVGGSFRAVTVWRSFFEDYFRQSGDLRVRWDSSIVSCTTPPCKAREGEFTGVPWYYPRKFISTATTADFGTPIRLASGWEARLIEAEVALRGGDVPTAMTLINSVRVRTPANAVRAGSLALSAWPNPGNSVQVAWDALRREREIELWLEGRSLGDLRRWIADGTYAQFTNGPDSDVADRVRMCIPISRNERNTNSNLSLTPDDPVSPIYNGVGAPW